MGNNVTPGHRIAWFVWGRDADGHAFRQRRVATMRGPWGYDVECECGWQTRTGGALRSYVEQEVRWHKLTVD